MAIGDGFKNIFLAGIGALTITGEKSKELVDQLVEGAAHRGTGQGG